MPFLRQRQQQFKLVDQPDAPSNSVVACKLARQVLANTEKPAGEMRLIAFPNRSIASANRSEFAIAA
jgi:hypothetical protein